jgi:predicted transcriptional regulator
MTDTTSGEAQDTGRQDAATELLIHTADIVAAFVGQSKASPDQLPEIIRSVHQTLAGIAAGGGQAAPQERQKPAVPVGKSVHHDYIVCLEDGAQLKMLKRYLRSRYDMSPDEYRRKWGLPPDYPMVAPAYAARRSEFARSIGLGKGVRRKA